MTIRGKEVLLVSVLHRLDVGDLNCIVDRPSLIRRRWLRMKQIAATAQRHGYLPSKGLVGLMDDLAAPVVKVPQLLDLESVRQEELRISYNEILMEAVLKLWWFPFDVRRIDRNQPLETKLHCLSQNENGSDLGCLVIER